jgi:hypothetical protein
MTRRKWTVLSGVLVVVVATAVVFLRGGRPGVEGRPEDVVRYMATDGFRRLTDEERHLYAVRLRGMAAGERAEAMARAGLSDQARERVLEVVYQEGAPGPVEEYGALKSPKEKRAYLDRIIQAGEGVKTRAGDGEVWSTEWRKRFLENTSALERARLAEFVGALNRRRAELGLGPEIPGR